MFLQLLSTGSTNTGVSARSFDTHLVISEDNYKVQNYSSLTEYPLLESNCKSALISPCFQAMNSQERDHKGSSDVSTLRKLEEVLIVVYFIKIKNQCRPDRTSPITMFLNIYRIDITLSFSCHY